MSTSRRKTQTIRGMDVPSTTGNTTDEGDDVADTVSAGSILCALLAGVLPVLIVVVTAVVVGSAGKQGEADVSA